jgi:hypothetical protein
MDRGLKLGNAGKASKVALLQLVGTPSQIEWAEQIRQRASGEFDRVSSALLAVARKQSEQDRSDTRAVVAILEERRVGVLARVEAGYFIRDWQELTDQVLRVIRKDPRYQAIRLVKAERQRPPNPVEGLMLPQQGLVKGDLHCEH